MTKQDRLNELKAEKQLFKEIDKYFDAGWREWGKEIHRQNDLSNIRMFKILSKVKGVPFIVELTQFMEKIKLKSALICLTKKSPKGILVKDNRFKTIPEFTINKYTSGQYRQGELYIQILPDRWIYFVY